MNYSCYTRIKATRHTCDSVMSHLWMSHVSHMNECLTCGWVFTNSIIWISRSSFSKFHELYHLHFMNSLSSEYLELASILALDSSECHEFNHPNVTNPLSLNHHELYYANVRHSHINMWTLSSKCNKPSVIELSRTLLSECHELSHTHNTYHLNHRGRVM